MIVECPTCHAYVEATEKGAFEYPWSDDGPGGRFVLLQCRRCLGPLLVVQDQTGNQVEGDS